MPSLRSARARGDLEHAQVDGFLRIVLLEVLHGEIGVLQLQRQGAFRDPVIVLQVVLGHAEYPDVHGKRLTGVLGEGGADTVR